MGEGQDRKEKTEEKEREQLVKKTDVIYCITTAFCSLFGKAHLRSNNSRRSRWTHFTLETLEERNLIN